MAIAKPRGIAVVDAGTTNTKVLLFNAGGDLLAERKWPTSHPEPPPYRSIDGEALLRSLPQALAELDAIEPVDRIVTSAHGSALALLDADGALALPMLHYTQEPPDEVRAEYERIAPPFSEVYAPVMRMSLTLGLQLHWQETRFPEAFSRVRTIVPWAQYVPFRLTGRSVSEFTGFGSQTQLWDVKANRFSSIARARGWDRLFAPRANAWDSLGTMLPAVRPAGFRGGGLVLAGVHDSNANYLRFLAGGLADFTLLSTGTWIIGFAPGGDLDQLDPERDTVTNTDVLGRPVPCYRFMGGWEMAAASGGAAASEASIETARRLIAAGSLALPSFTDTGGPVAATGGRGRYVGPAAVSPAERASLASIYCALMTYESMRAAGARGEPVVDGPFGTNEVFCRVLARLAGRPVKTSALREGTAAGAALLGHMTGNGVIPTIGIELKTSLPIDAAGFDGYVAEWRRLTGI